MSTDKVQSIRDVCFSQNCRREKFDLAGEEAFMREMTVKEFEDFSEYHSDPSQTIRDLFEIILNCVETADGQPVFDTKMHLDQVLDAPASDESYAQTLQDAFLLVNGFVDEVEEAEETVEGAEGN